MHFEKSRVFPFSSLFLFLFSFPFNISAVVLRSFRLCFLFFCLFVLEVPVWMDMVGFKKEKCAVKAVIYINICVDFVKVSS